MPPKINKKNDSIIPPVPRLPYIPNNNNNNVSPNPSSLTSQSSSAVTGSNDKKQEELVKSETPGLQPGNLASSSPLVPSNLSPSSTSNGTTAQAINTQVSDKKTEQIQNTIPSGHSQPSFEVTHNPILLGHSQTNLRLVNTQLPFNTGMTQNTNDEDYTQSEVDNMIRDVEMEETPSHPTDGQIPFENMSDISYTKLGKSLTQTTVSTDTCKQLKLAILRKKSYLEQMVIRQMTLQLIATPSAQEMTELTSLLEDTKKCREEITGDEQNLVLLQSMHKRSSRVLSQLKGQSLTELLNVLKKKHTLPDYRKMNSSTLFSVDRWMNEVSETISATYRLQLGWTENDWQAFGEGILLRYADALIELSEGREIYSHGLHQTARKQGWTMWLNLLRSCFAQPILEYTQLKHLLFQHRMLEGESLMSWCSRIDTTLSHIAFSSEEEREALRWGSFIYGMNDDLAMWLIPTYVARITQCETKFGSYVLTIAGITEANKRCSTQFTYENDRQNSSALYLCMLQQTQDKMLSRGFIINEVQMETPTLVEVHYNHPSDTLSDKQSRKRLHATHTGGRQTPVVSSYQSNPQTPYVMSSSSGHNSQKSSSRHSQSPHSRQSMPYTGKSDWNVAGATDLVVEIDEKGDDRKYPIYFTVPRPYKVQMYNTVNTHLGSAPNPQRYKVTLSQSQCDVFYKNTGIKYPPVWCRNCCKHNDDRKKFNCHPTELCQRFFRYLRTNEEKETASKSNPLLLIQLPMSKN